MGAHASVRSALESAPRSRLNFHLQHLLPGVERHEQRYPRRATADQRRANPARPGQRALQRAPRRRARAARAAAGQAHLPQRLVILAGIPEQARCRGADQPVVDPPQRPASAQASLRRSQLSRRRRTAQRILIQAAQGGRRLAAGGERHAHPALRLPYRQRLFHPGHDVRISRAAQNPLERRVQLGRSLISLCPPGRCTVGIWCPERSATRPARRQ